MNRQHQHPHHQEDIPPFFEPILQYYNALPPITRTWFTFSLITTGLHTLEIFDMEQLILVWDKIPPPRLELWRIITSFTWAGPGTMVDFPVLMLLYSMAVVVPGYERDPHDASWIEVERPGSFPQPQENTGNNSQHMRDRIVNQWVRRRPVHRQSDCVFAFLMCTIFILLTYLLVTETTILFSLLPYVYIARPFLMPIFTRTLLYSMITLQSLKHPDQQQNINFFPVPGRYVPLFHVVFGLLMKYRINETIHGILVGFTYAFLVKEEGQLALLLGRKRLLCTPQWLIQLMGEEGVVGDVITQSTRGGEADANVPYRGVRLEQGANFLHHAASIGDVTYIQSQIDQLHLISSPADLVAATTPFSQGDRNDWQPLHEAARAGEFHVLLLLLEVSSTADPLGNRSWTRIRPGRLKVDVNARTNNGTGLTALRLVEENHGEDHDCAELLRQLGGVSLGFGDETEDEE
mmetsp:Transcript_4791/g.8925  ORF Transcript_4791/g.8925 Transcript_4791/m.8925 type:complete len:463 (-) Transcript_4791:188-1576(-)